MGKKKKGQPDPGNSQKKVRVGFSIRGKKNSVLQENGKKQKIHGQRNKNHEELDRYKRLGGGEKMAEKESTRKGWGMEQNVGT